MKAPQGELSGPAVQEGAVPTGVADGMPLPENGGLGAKARSAVVWNTAFNLFRDITQFVTMLVLVRLLAPASYGEFSLTTGIVGFFAVFGFNLFVAHSLQVQDEGDTMWQEHFTAGAFLNGALMILMNVFAACLWFIPKYAAVAPYVHAMSITFLLEWPCELRRKMLERQMNWRRLRTLHAIGIASGAVLAPLMAWAGAGTWALLLPGLIVTLPFIWDLFVREAWRPTWAWDRGAYQPALRFGIQRVGSGASNTGRVLLESSVLTAILGFAGLGIYTRSIGLSVIFCSKFASQLVYSIYPILTRIERHGGDPVRTGNLVLRLIAWTSIPVATILGTLAGPVVQVVYGPQWEGVIPLLPWALLVTVLAALIATGSALLLARQQAMRCLALDVGYFVGTAAILPVARHGAIVYLAGLAIVLGLELVLLFHWLRRARAVDWRGIANAVAAPLTVVAIVWTTLQALPLTRASSDGGFTGARLVIWCLMFAGTYVVGVRILYRRSLEGLVNVLPHARLIRRALLMG